MKGNNPGKHAVASPIEFTVVVAVLVVAFSLLFVSVGQMFMPYQTENIPLKAKAITLCERLIKDVGKCKDGSTDWEYQTENVTYIGLASYRVLYDNWLENGTALYADAGGPYTGMVNEEITLHGFASGGKTPYSYTWYIYGRRGTDYIWVTNDTEPDAIIKFLREGNYTLILFVEDSTGLSTWDATYATIYSQPSPPSPEAPVVITENATNVTTDSAVLNGYLVSPGTPSDSCDVYFEYGLVGAPVFPMYTEKIHNATVGHFRIEIRSLESNKTYWFRAIAENVATGEKSYGENKTFTTYECPIVYTDNATNVNTTSATLNGHLISLGIPPYYIAPFPPPPLPTDGGAASSPLLLVEGIGQSLKFESGGWDLDLPLVSNAVCYVWFEYGKTTSYGNVTSREEVTEPGTYFNATVLGLEPGTVYHFRAVAELVVQDSKICTSYGEDKAFKTNSPPLKPNKPTGSSSGNTGTSYTFATSTTDPDGDNVSYCWDWGDGTYSGWSDPYPSGQKHKATHVWAYGGTYPVRVKAKDDPYGAESEWSDPLWVNISGGKKPVVTTKGAENVTLHSATLVGFLNSPGVPAEQCKVCFKYGTSPGNYPYSTPWMSKSEPGYFSYNISGLNPGTTYYFIAVANNTPYQDEGAELNFTTSNCPSVETKQATNITTTSATLKGYLNDLGIPNECEVRFELFDANWTLVLTTQPISMSHPGPFSKTVSFLTPGAIYHFRAVANNSVCTSYGANLTFTTPSENRPPNKPSTPSGPSSGNPGTSYTFTTSTTDPDGDNVSYYWDWGDGSYSGWSDLHPSGCTVSASHSWSSTGVYYIRVKAKDASGAESDWSDFHSITIQITPTTPTSSGETCDTPTCSGSTCDSTCAGETCEGTCQGDYTCCPCCLPAGTKIAMADGSYKNIEDISVGDKVLSFDVKDNKIKVTKVVEKIIRIREGVYSINGGLIKLTNDHPVYVKKSNGTTGWASINPIYAKKGPYSFIRNIMKLEVGDRIFTMEGTWINITSIDFIKGPIVTYSFKTSMYDGTFFANNILVHNSPACTCADITPTTGSTCGSTCDCCFLAGTKIVMADGTSKDIEDVKVGDKVLSFDESTGRLTEGTVVATFYHPDTDSYLVINNILKVTPNHPIYVNGKWLPAGHLKLGDKLRTVSGKLAEVKSIKLIREHVGSYNLEIAPYHTYFAEGILVHNKATPTVKNTYEPCCADGSCFLEGTKIAMADGSFKNIEDVKAGDEIISFDEKNKSLTISKVTKVFYHPKTESYLVINGILRVTPNHPIYVNGKWLPAGKINIGDKILTLDGKLVRVRQIRKIERTVSSYNLEVSPYHTYFADGFLVHNKASSGGVAGSIGSAGGGYLYYSPLYKIRTLQSIDANLPNISISYLNPGRENVSNITVESIREFTFSSKSAYFSIKKFYVSYQGVSWPVIRYVYLLRRGGYTYVGRIMEAIPELPDYGILSPEKIRALYQIPYEKFKEAMGIERGYDVALRIVDEDGRELLYYGSINKNAKVLTSFSRNVLIYPDFEAGINTYRKATLTVYVFK